MTRPVVPRSSLDAIAPHRPRVVRFLLFALAVPILLAGLMVWLHAEYTNVEALRARMSIERRIDASMLVADITDAVSNERGYALTGDATFRAQALNARVQAERAFRHLRSDLADRPQERRLLAWLGDLAARKFDELDRDAVARAAAGRTARDAGAGAGAGADVMRAMRTISTRMLALAADEGNAAVDAVEARIAADRHALWAMIAATGLVAICAAMMSWRQETLQYGARTAAYSVAERNRSIFESTVDAIAICSPCGTIETINAAASRLLGYRPDELEGQHVTLLIDLPGDGDDFLRRIGLVDGLLVQPYSPDRRLRHRDGHELTVDIALGVMHLPDGTYIVASVRDMSERKRTERMKDELLSTVNHELRTPLTAVVGALGLLRAQIGETTPRAAARLIEIAENNSHRLIRLINDMLEIDRIQSEILHLDRARSDLRTVLERACVGSRGLAEAADIVIVCDLPEMPVTVAIDADRVLQVVSNLIANAVRASPPAGVVTIRLTLSGSRRKAVVAVDDDGAGVPLEFRDRIFGRFERAGRQSGSGTGLGLAICRDIVERHGGRIWFEDRPGGGSRFAFVLDLVRDAPVAHAAAPDPAVLVCEGDAARTATLHTLLGSSGHTAECVATAAAARTALATQPYRALLPDLDVPDEAGLSLARAISAPRDAATPTVILLATTPRGRPDEPAALNLLDWLEQPVDPVRLRAAVRRVVDRMPARRPLLLLLEDDATTRALVAETLGATVSIVVAADFAAAKAILDVAVPDIAVINPHAAATTGADCLPILVDITGLSVPTIVLCAQGCSIAYTGRIETVLVAASGSVPDLGATVRRALRDADRYAA